MRSKGIRNFLGQFKFEPENTLKIGVESEYFLADKTGNIVPQAKQALDALQQINAELQNGSVVLPYGYELSACQIEVRTQPVAINALEAELIRLEHPLNEILNSLQLQLLSMEVAPTDMPLDVFPDPTGRYAKITKNMPKDVLLAACRVIGTHVHVGMPDPEIALSVYNQVISSCDELCDLGDHTNGQRLAIYRVVEPNCAPPSYDSWSNFYDIAEHKGFVHDPCQCWTLIRITKYGTIEFRMFGAAESRAEVIEWAKHCYQLCARAIAIA